MDPKDYQKVYNRFFSHWIEAMAAAGAANTGPLPTSPGWWYQTPAPTVAAADADSPAAPPTPLKEAEDRVALWLNGGGCTKTQHDAASTLEKLIMLKQLRIELPHQSTQARELDAAIAKEAKK